MIRIMLAIAVLIFSIGRSYALDLYLNNSNVLSAPIPLLAISPAGTPINDLVIGDITGNYFCSGGGTVAFNSGSGTLTKKSNVAGGYEYTANDVIVTGAGGCNPPTGFFPNFYGTGVIVSVPEIRLVPVTIISGTLSAGSTSTSLISSTFVGTDSSDYVGWIAIVGDGAQIVKSFNPATDTVTLDGSIGTVATGDRVLLVPDKIWEILSRVRTIR